VLPRFLVDGVAAKFPGEHVLYDVDFDRTTAFVHGDGMVYVNDTERFERGTVAPGKVPQIKEELVVLFEYLTDPESGDPVLEVADGDDLFPTDHAAPDLVVGGAPAYQTRNSLADRLLAPAETTAGGHLKEGIFLAWGPSIDAGVRPQDATVYDLAPTLLQDVGEPIPEAADGRVLSEIFRDWTPATESEPETRSYSRNRGADGGSTAEDDFDAVEERLQGLGYMS
jgi:predicted AlkP superfamily phosphohydrolase/phosphomutase